MSDKNPPSDDNLPDVDEIRESDERDFTGGAIHALSPHRGTTGDAEVDRKVRELVENWSKGGHEELIEELIVTALNMAQENHATGDMKLINRATKEFRAACNVFAPYIGRRKVSIYGSARTPPEEPEYKAAALFASRMREEGFMSITGAGDGIMGAGQEGAGRDDSFGLNINLPFEQGANATITGDEKLILFNYFFTRKLFFVKESDAVALFPGGFGTMDECFENLTLMQTGKASIVPIVMVDSPGGVYWKTFNEFIRGHLCRLKLISEDDFSLFKITDDIEDAVSEITGFYRNFHSYRYVGDRLIIRLRHKLPDEVVTSFNEEFAVLLARGKFVQGEALDAEVNEPGIAHLPRLVFTHNRRNFGTLRRLIDAVNDRM